VAGLAAVAALERNAEQTGRLWGVVESFEHRLGAQLLPPSWRRIKRCCSRSKAPPSRTSVDAGHALTLDEATHEVLASP
jgi:hypothetical protein